MSHPSAQKLGCCSRFVAPQMGAGSGPLLWKPLFRRVRSRADSTWRTPPGLPCCHRMPPNVKTMPAAGRFPSELPDTRKAGSHW